MTKTSVQVRRWISSNKLYSEVLEPVLMQWNEKVQNDLDEDGSLKLDKVDKFISLFVRLEALEETARTKRQLEEDHRINGRAAHGGGIAALDQVIDKAQVEVGLQLTIEVIWWDELLEGNHPCGELFLLLP